MKKYSLFLLAGGLLLPCVAEVSITNECAVFAFDGKGRIVSIRTREDGRELLARPTPFVGVRLPYCGFLGADRMELREGLMVFTVPGGRGDVALRPIPFASGCTFEVAGFNVPEAQRLYVGRVAPSCQKWQGGRANMMSDERAGVCLRAYDLFGENGCGAYLQAHVPAARASGARFGLVAAVRGRLQKALQDLTLASGRPHSPGGGAWALGGEASRGSYLNASVTEASLDDWIDLVERGGFDVLHFRENWYACRGHYPVSTNAWPGGLAAMKAAVAKIHAAGYRAGMHTLTACIDPKDPWVAGPENRHLLAWETYSLDADISPDATELVVDAPPVKRHDTIFSYSGNGNALRIGNEIVQYTAYTDKPPYTYSGLTRGAFGTKPAAHAKGDSVAYLQQRYIAFYPAPDSPLADAVADAIAAVYNECGFDQIYCDGAEGMFSPYGTATMRDKIIARCAADGRPCLNEDSCSGPSQVWWYHSRVGAWDSCFWAPKRFHDFHVEHMKSMHLRESDMLELQMGWWAPFLGNPHFACHKLDDMEYYASRNAGLDASMSIAAVNVSLRQLAFHSSRMMTILGWYERARRARAFAPGVREAFDRLGAEFRFRQDAASGLWNVAPVKSFHFRAKSPETATRTFTLEKVPAQTALRVEALYVGENPNGKNSLLLTEGATAKTLSVATANTNVSLKVEESVTADGLRTFRLSAANRSLSARGAWARATASFSPYRRPERRWVLRFRVKGDGSGALLNVQVETPREYGNALSEHYVTLDFKGWRDFEMPMRERDAERYADYVWPYRGYAEVFHRIINMNNVSAVNYYLNEIPAGGTAVVEVTDVTLVPQRQTKAVPHAVCVNGKSLAIPFAMYSGWFAELEEGVWTLYSADGDPLERKVTGDTLALAAGANEVSYGGGSVDGTRPCAEVTVFAIGETRAALKPVASLPPEAKKFLSYEAMDPQFFAPAKGFTSLPPLVMRPGETATAEVTVYGPMPPCTVTVGTVSTALDAVEKGKHRKFILKGRHSGVQPILIAPHGPEGEIAARFEFVKRYRSETK